MTYDIDAALKDSSMKRRKVWVLVPAGGDWDGWLKGEVMSFDEKPVVLKEGHFLGAKLVVLDRAKIIGVQI